MLKIYKYASGISAYIKHGGLIEIRMLRHHRMSWRIAEHSVPIVMDGDLMIPKQAIGNLKCSEVFNHAKGLRVYRRFMRSLEHLEIMSKIYTALNIYIAKH